MTDYWTGDELDVQIATLRGRIGSADPDSTECLLLTLELFDLLSDHFELCSDGNDEDGALRDVDEAISRLTALLTRPGLGSPERAEVLWRAGMAHDARSAISAEHSDLDAAIGYLTGALAGHALADDVTTVIHETLVRLH